MISLMVILSGSLSIGAAEGATKASPCDESEYVFFSCEVSRGRHAALCGTARGGQVTSRRYVFGKQNKPDLVYPTQGSHADFTVSHYLRHGVEYNEVHSRNNGADYTIYKRYDLHEGPTILFGVEARSAGGREEQFTCKAGTVTDRLSKFMEGLRCDSESALGC